MIEGGGATSHRAVVPMMPSRTWPPTSSRREARSCSIDRSSPITRRARSATISPSGVSSLRAVDEGRAEFLFEAGDVRRDVGLDGMERSRRSREGLVFGNGEEGMKLSKIHRCE